MKKSLKSQFVALLEPFFPGLFCLTHLACLTCLACSICLASFCFPKVALAEKTPAVLSPGIKAVMDKPVYAQADWGLLVVDLKTGQDLDSLNSEKFFSPGSTTKLFTVAAALDALGTNYRFKTPVYARSRIDRQGRLAGDLILVASGDPTLDGRTTPQDEISYTDADHTDANALGIGFLTLENPLAGLDKLALQVAKKGIKEIQGEVIIDTRLFTENPAPSLDLDYPLSPIMVNDNLIDFIIQPQNAGSPAVVSWRPRTSYFEIDAQVTTAAADASLDLDIFSPQKQQIVLRGQVPAGFPPVVRTFQVKDPASFARTLFIEALQRQGIKLAASPLGPNPASLLPDAKIYSKLTKAAELVSPPFKENARLILKVSHNLGANTLLILIALKNGRQTLEEGLLCEQRFFRRAGLDTSLFSLGDGEGGVQSDQISPRAVNQLLQYMSRRADFADYLRALPVLGVDGSLAGVVSEDSPAYGRVRAKTGTSGILDPLNLRLFLKAKALAGYMTSSHGYNLAFVVFVNNVPGGPAADAAGTTEFMMSVGRDLGRIAEAIYLAY